MTDQTALPQEDDDKLDRMFPLHRAMQDGPNTHHYRTYTMGTTFRVVHTTDVDGVRHTFHVPLEVAQALDAARAASPSDGLRAVLDQWQMTATDLSDALIAVGGHPVGKHEAPQEYDSLSSLACTAPKCLAALRLALEATGEGSEPAIRTDDEFRERPCPACGAALSPSETHWSLMAGIAGGYVCPATGEGSDRT